MPNLLANFLQILLYAIWLLLLVRVLLSWWTPRGASGLVAFVYQVTEPILAPIRRIVPPMAGLDWSPLIALLLLGALLRVVVRL